MLFELFLIVPPGLEDLAKREIEQKCPAAPMTLGKGGITLMADLDWVVRSHALLKIPTRLLLRLTQFKVRDFPKLHQKLVNFKWNSFLSHPDPHWEISARRSRLLHTGRIEETATAALKEALVKQPLSRDWEKKGHPPQTFYLRLEDDVLTLSLDLSGDPLYKRGLQAVKGEAPLRESFAAALLMELFKGVQGPVTLADPMCGSGTFLTEALTFHLPLHLRPFAFESAPFFKGKTFRLPEALTPFPIAKAQGFDLDGELLKKITTDLPVTLEALDSLSSRLPISGEVLMICNPPYGERIKVDGKRGSFLKRAREKFFTVDRPRRFAWVLPSDMDDLFPEEHGYKLRTKRRFRNGGMAVTFWCWEREGL